MNKIQLKNIFDLINPCYPKYRILIYGRNNMIYISYYELEKYSEYYVLAISADYTGEEYGVILSFVLSEKEVK